MTAVPAYLSLSRHPRGSYAWAMDQLDAGNEVRRSTWPIEVRNPTYTAIWKVYPTRYERPCSGFSSGCVGADMDSWGSLGMDSGGYYPSVEDHLALDWQLVTDVTAAEIAWHDAHRVPVTPNPYVEQWQRVNSRQDFLWALLFIVIAIGGLGLYVAG